MKKLLYTLLAAAATLFVVGCEKELRNDSLDSSDLVQATFNVGFADAATKAISDGLTATQLVVGVYDKSGDTYVQSLSWAPDAADHKNAFSALNAKFTASLVKGHEYKIVFLAVAPDNGVYTIDLAAKTFTAAVSGPSNAEARDAFYGVWETEDKVSGAINANVILKRPFAQINVIDLKADFDAAKDALVNFKESSLKVKAPKVLNIYDGTVATDADYVFAKAAMSVEHPDFEPYKTAGDYWILTDYILAGTASQTVDLEFALYDTAGAELVKYPVANVPIQRNYRTNIYGSLLTAGGEFNVIIAPEYDGMNEFPIEGKAPEITWTDTSLSNYADGTPMEFTLGEKTTINFAATHPLATIKPTSTSSNPAVGTINEAGLFTVVGAGTTVVTVAFPAVVDGVAVKGADNTYASYSINYIVKVNPVVVELQDAELAVTGAPTAAVAAGGTFDLTVSSKSDAEITVAVAPTAAATVGAPVSGKYTVTAAADLTADTEVTVTFSQVATEAYKAASKEVKFTVLKKADDPQPQTGKTVAELKALITAANTTFEAPVTLGTVIVTAVKGSNVWIEDNSGAILLYQSGHTLEAGKSYTGATVPGGTFYNTLYEITSFDVTNATVADATIPVTEITIAQLLENFLDYESRRVKLTGVTVTSAVPGTDKTVPVTQNGSATNLYIRYEQAYKAQSVLNVVGNVSKYSGAAQIAVFAEADVTVISEGKTTATIAFPSGATSVEVGATKAFAATTNSDATITYASDTPGVATIAADGTITAVAEGTAKVTASVAETANFTAASITATVTVTAVGATVEYGEETIVFSELGYENGAEVATVNGQVVTLTLDKGTNSNAPKYYTTGSAVRLYGGNTMKVESEKTISEIAFTFASGEGTNEIGADSGAIADGTWTGNASSVLFTIAGTSGHRRIASIKVTYIK